MLQYENFVPIMSLEEVCQFHASLVLGGGGSMSSVEQLERIETVLAATGLTGHNHTLVCKNKTWTWSIMRLRAHVNVCMFITM